MYEDVARPEIIKGAKLWKNEGNKFNILMLHYSADPGKDPDRDGKEWYDKEKEGAPKAVWNKEYEIDFTTKSGRLVYGPDFCDFDARIHLLNSYELDSNVEFFMAMDFGQRNPNCVLVAALTMDNRIFIIDEYYKPSIPSVASRDMFEKFGYLMPGYEDRLTIRQKKVLADNTFQLKVIDPSTAHKNRTKIVEGEEVEYSVIEDFDDNGWEFEKAHNDFDAGVTRVREYFAVDGLGRSHLYIFEDKCPNLVNELHKYRYQENTEATNRTKNEPEKPVKKNDHAMDALRYLMMTRPIRPELAARKQTTIEKDIQGLLKPQIINDFEE